MLTRPRNRKGNGGVVAAVRQHTGLTDILEWVGKASGIDDNVRSSFSEGDAAKILSIALPVEKDIFIFSKGAFVSKVKVA